MQASIAHTAERDGTFAFAAAGVLGGLIAFGAMMAIAMSRNGWVFEYPLDDVYIHLAMAEQIASGGYGVNAGEFASAASSPLYPLLLTPLAEHPIQRWWPLLWNILALSVASALFGIALARAGFGRTGIVLAAAAPLALSTYVTAFTGMENMAHAAASLAIVLGLWRFIEVGRIGGLLVAGIFMASAFRIEAVALGLAAGGVVAILGGVRAGVGLMALAILPVAVFAAFLVALGLEPLPNSVLAKLGDMGPAGPLDKFAANANAYGGRYLFGLSLVVLCVGAATLTRDRRRGYFALAISAAGLAHLAFGSTGWMDRYETYANISLVAALALMLSTAAPWFRTLAVSAALLGGFVTYARYALPVYAWNPAAISAQQGQMARFAKDFVKGPVAVNDIGYAAWHNPDYVLDLWGLASAEALSVRAADPSQGWAGPLTVKHGAALAMIYDRWLSDAVPSGWRRRGTLHLDVPSAFLGDREVAFYATDPVHSRSLTDALGLWESALPERARFEFAEDAR